MLWPARHGWFMERRLDGLRQLIQYDNNFLLPAPVHAAKRQQDELRFTHLPLGSANDGEFRCLTPICQRRRTRRREPVAAIRCG